MNNFKELKDLEIRNLATEQEFKAACEHYSNPAFWHFVYANEIRCFGVSNMPILAETMLQEKHMEETVNNEQFCECVAENGLFTAIPNMDGNAYETYAGRYTCHTSMYDRSGTACRMVKTISSKGKISALSAEERGEEVNRGWNTSAEKIAIYIPDGKISFFGSEKYVILPFIDGYNAVKEELAISYPDAEYTTGRIDHEYILGEWKLNASEEEEYALMLENIGAINQGEETPFYLRFSTSNVGNAKMSVRLMVSLNGIKIPLGKQYSIWHHSDKAVASENNLNNDNGCCISNLKAKLTWLGSLMKENENIIEALGNTDINHPAGCLQHLLAEMNTISAKDKKKAIEDMQALYPNTCTAIDVYLMASSLAGSGTSSPRQVVNITEEVAELQFKNFTLYDKPLAVTD